MLRVLEKGFAPYKGGVSPFVYDELGCPWPEVARWFAHHAKPYICLGCSAACVWGHAEGGFELVRAKHKNKATQYYAALETVPAISAEKYLSLCYVVRVPEAALLMGVSERHIYDLIDEGKLVALQEKPVRVTTESIRERLKLA